MITRHEINAMEDIKSLLAEADIAVRGRTPTEALSDALHTANRFVAVLGHLVASLKPRAEASSSIIGDGPRERTEWTTTVEGLVGPDPDGVLGVHPWVRLYNEWVDRQAKLSKMAIDVGLMERQTRVQEAQTGLMAKALMNILRDLHIDLDSPDTQRIIETHLLALDEPVQLGTGLTATATSS